MPQSVSAATDLDLISYFKAIPDARMRRGVRIPAWYLLLAAVLGIKAGITQLRGQWLVGEGPLLGGRSLMPLLHPSYLLRNPSLAEGKPRWLTAADLRLAAGRLRQLSGGL